MSDISVQIGEYFGGACSKKKDEEPAVYTGAYAKFDLKSKDIGEEHLVLKTNREGKVVAVLYGGQILPFAVETVCERERAEEYRTKYRKGLQGRIHQILGEKPKGVA